MVFPITDLAALTDLPPANIVRNTTRIITKENPLATKLTYITIDQLANVIIGSKLTLSAPCATTSGTAYTPGVGAAAINQTVSFTISTTWRTGFISGAQFICTAGAGVAIKCNTINYDPITGILTGTVIDTDGAVANINWTAAYLTSFFAAAAVEFTPTSPYPSNVTNVQSALDWLGQKFSVIVSTYEETVVGAAKTTFTINPTYNPMGLQVFINGLLLNQYNYTATNGSTVTLTSPLVANINDRFKTLSYQPLNLATPINAYTLNGQLPSYYLDLSHMTGSLAANTIIDCGTL